MPLWFPPGSLQYASRLLDVIAIPFSLEYCFPRSPRYAFPVPQDVPLLFCPDLVHLNIPVSPVSSGAHNMPLWFPPGSPQYASRLLDVITISFFVKILLSKEPTICLSCSAQIFFNSSLGRGKQVPGRGNNLMSQIVVAVPLVFLQH